MGERGEGERGKRKEKRRGEQVTKGELEAAKLLVKSLGIIEKYEEMGLEERRKMKRVEETVEQYKERMQKANVEAIKVSLKVLIEG